MIIGTLDGKVLTDNLEIDYGTIDIASGIKIGYLSQDLFWKSDKNTLRQEMLELFPEINAQIKRLDEIKEDVEAWEEAEELNKSLLAVD